MNEVDSNDEILFTRQDGVFEQSGSSECMYGRFQWFKDGRWERVGGLQNLWLIY